MEQVEGGDLIVNRGNESRPKETSSDSVRELNVVDGYEAACKLAQVDGYFTDINHYINSQTIVYRPNWIKSSRVTPSHLWFKTRPTVVQLPILISISASSHLPQLILYLNKPIQPLPQDLLHQQLLRYICSLYFICLIHGINLSIRR